MPDQKLKTNREWLLAIIKQYESALILYARRFLQNLEKAQEVVQETFLKLCDQDRSQIEDHVAAWLYTVCRNRAIDVRRKEKLMSSFDQLKLEQIDTNQPANLELLEQEQVKGTVFVLLANLPENQQEVIRLKFQHGLSYREISDVTKLSETNVGFLIHTGMKELRQKLKTSL